MEGDAPTRLEAELHERLQGCRLVLEAGLTRGDRDQVRKLAMLMVARAADPSAYLVEKMPATYVCHLVSEGIYSYDGGLWPHVIKPIADQQFDFDCHPGYRFTLALERLSLEPFERLPTEEKTHKWVGRIMAHAGVPVAAAPGFLGLLRSELEHGWRDADELLSAWRSSRATLDQVRKPTKHFLLHGGETATDFVSRCIELLEISAAGSELPGGEQLGLPQYLVDCCKELGSPSGSAPGRRAGIGSLVWMPRPSLVMDPYAGLGPTILLPALPPELASGRWHVDTGDQLSEVRGSAIKGAAVRLHPERSWRAEFRSSDGVIREWSFEGLDRVTALVVDPDSGHVARDPRSVRLGQAIVVAPAAFQLSARGADGEACQLPEIAELPPMIGAWSEFVARHVDLEDVARLELFSPIDQTAQALYVSPPKARPRLEGEPVRSVTNRDGFPVFREWPALVLPQVVGPDRVSWRVSLRTPSESTAVPVEAGTSQVPLEAAGEGAELIPVELSAKGPLGSDLVERFIVSPGLRLGLPKKVVLPFDDIQGIRAQADAPTSVAGQGSATTLEWPEGSTLLAFDVEWEERKLELVASLPLLVWSISHETKRAVAPSAEVDRVAVEEFDDRLADILTVRTGVPGTTLMLILGRPKRGLAYELLQQGETCVARGFDGRWSFDLAPFAGTVAELADATLSFYLEVNGQTVRVADLIRGVSVSQLQANSRYVGESAFVSVTFEQEKAVTDRVVRLWSADRPWQQAIQAPVPDGELDVEIIDDDGRLPPGRYLVEVAVADEWVEASRPSPDAPNVELVELGAAWDRQSRLEGLDPLDPNELLELAVAGDPPREDQPVASISSANGPKFVLSLLALLSQFSPKERPPRGFQLLRRLASESLDPLLTGVVEVAAVGDRASAPMRRLAIRLLRLVRDVAPAPEQGAGADAWKASPVLAAVIDRRAADVDIAAAERMERFLGWRPGEGLPLEGGSVSMNEAGKSAEELRALAGFLNLVPGAILGSTNLQVANFEWLIAEKEAYAAGDRGAPNEWFHEYKVLWADAKERYLDADKQNAAQHRVWEHLVGREPAPGTFEFAGLPAVVLSAAISYVLRDSNDGLARTALEEALSFSPRLVEHDVILCAVTFPTYEAPDA